MVSGLDNLQHADPAQPLTTASETDDNGQNAMMPRKKKGTRHTTCAPLAIGTNLQKKKVPDVQKKKEKKKSWADVGPRSV